MSGVRVNRFKKLAIQQRRVPEGEKSGGEREDSNPRKGVHEGGEQVISRKKSMKERQGARHRAREEWRRREQKRMKGERRS